MGHPSSQPTNLPPNQSMIMPWRRPLLRHPLILGCTIQHHPFTQLPRLPSENILPRCLALRHFIPALFLQLAPSAGQFLVRDQDSHDALREVDAEDVPVSQQSQVSTGGGFGAGVEDGGGAGGAGLATVADAGERSYALFEDVAWGVHVDYFGGATVERKNQNLLVLGAGAGEKGMGEAELTDTLRVQRHA